MTNTTINKSDILVALAIVTMILVGGTWLLYGAIIGVWLKSMATITVIGFSGFVGLGLFGGMGYLFLKGGHGAIELAKHGAILKAEIQLINEKVEMERANTAYRHAQIQSEYANSELVRAESVAKAWGITEISHKRGALIMVNGQPVVIPPFEQPSAAMPLLAQGESDFEWDSDKLFRAFRTAKSAHGLIIGSRNSGKTTFINALNNEVFSHCDITIIDILFNKVESGWLLPDNAKVSRDFVGTLREFYASHKKQADNSTTKRIVAKPKILVIDEVPSLLASLKASDKKLYEDCMAMLRAIYSQGSHTQFNLILMSQTVLSEDIGLSNNDKQNFIQVCLGGLSGEFLALKRGKGDKARGLYARLESVASEGDYYSVFVDCNGAIDVQPLPDLSQYGAKRFYGQSVETESQADNEGAESVASEESESIEIAKPSIFGLPEMSDYEKGIVDSATNLLADNAFSLNKLHFALTGQKLSNGQYNATYKEIMTKFGVKWQSQKVTS